MMDPTNEPYYGLASKTEGVGFYKSTIEVVPANKAYLLGSNISSSTPTTSAVNAYLFHVGETTGIGQVATDAQSEPAKYYDLNGRRVLYPTRGIYVTGNGQKVLIK